MKLEEKHSMFQLNPIFYGILLQIQDASKTSFKSSTRLECMMQDYPKTLPPSARVGFTVIYSFLSEQVDFQQVKSLTI